MCKTVKFWHYHHGNVLIKLKAGQTLRHSYGGETDEGWCRDVNIWSFDGHTLRVQYRSNSQDCDGIFSSHGESTCSARRVRMGYSCPDESGITYPEWKHGESGQRD